MKQEDLIDHLEEKSQSSLPEDAEDQLTEAMNHINGFLKEFTNQLAQSDLDPDEYFLGSDGIMSIITLALRKNKLNFSRYKDGILVEFYDQQAGQVKQVDKIYFSQDGLISKKYQAEITDELVDKYIESFQSIPQE